MNLLVSSLSKVAEIQSQSQQPITKILGILEYNPSLAYANIPCEKTWIRVHDHELDLELDSPKEHHVYDILNFCTTLKPIDNIIVHCHAGISRSTAAALIIMYTITKDIDKCVELLLDMRPQASPNRLLCKIGDDILGSGTKIFDAANALNIKNGYVELSNKSKTH
jgi:predicted protein tyrosine phosphatase